MKSNANNRPVSWTPEDRARHQAIREKFRDCPTIDELIDQGDLSGFPIPHGAWLQYRLLIAALKQAREAAGLSLDAVAKRSGIDKAALSRLETGRQSNPTVETLLRYAAAINRQISWQLAASVKTRVIKSKRVKAT